MNTMTYPKWFHFGFVSLFLLCLPLHAQLQPPGGGEPPCTNCPPIVNPPPAPGRTLLDLDVRHVGTLRVELFDRDKPKSAQNFISYVLSGAYSNSILHRASTNFVVQGGSLQIITFTGGNKSVAPVAEKTNAVVNERGIGTVFNNAKGTLALAHYPGLTNESSCHWFINLADNPQLDVIDTNNAYTVFGRVIGGLDLLDKLNPSATNTTTKVLNLGGWLDEAPVRSSATLAGITYDDLLTTTWRVVALDMGLTVEQQTNDTRRLTWLSVSNKTHRVEFAPTVTNSWTLLWTTNGNGSTQSFTHSSNTVTGFYRMNYQP